RGWLQKDEGQFAHDPGVFGGSGGAALYRRSSLETVGLLDADFVAYLEDVDLAWRIPIAGYRAAFAPNAIVYHKHSASTAPNSPWKTYISERNRIWNLVQNYPLWYVALAPPWNAARNIVALRRRIRPNRYPITFGQSLTFRDVVRAHLQGRYDAYQGVPRAVQKRRVREVYRESNCVGRGGLVPQVRHPDPGRTDPLSYRRVSRRPITHSDSVKARTRTFACDGQVRARHGRDGARRFLPDGTPAQERLRGLWARPPLERPEHWKYPAHPGGRDRKST